MAEHPRAVRAARRRPLIEARAAQRPPEAELAAPLQSPASSENGSKQAVLDPAAAKAPEARPAVPAPFEASLAPERPTAIEPPTRLVTDGLAEAGPAVQLLAPAAPPERIEAVYQDLLGLQRRAGLALAVSAGGLLVPRLYGGDFGAYRSRGPKVDASLRALAERFKAAGLLGFSATNLSRAIALAELVAQRGGVPSLEHRRLSLGHLRAALGAPAEQRAALLDRAEAEGWTAERLPAEAAKQRAPAGERRGRPPLPGVVKTLNQLERLLEGDDDALGGLECVEAPDAGEAARLYAAGDGDAGEVWGAAGAGRCGLTERAGLTNVAQAAVGAGGGRPERWEARGPTRSGSRARGSRAAHTAAHPRRRRSPRRQVDRPVPLSP